MRRLFGACILGAGDRWIDCSALVRQALRRLVLAGAELLQIAGVQEAQLAKDVVELNCRAYLMRWVFKPWRESGEEEWAWESGCLGRYSFV